MLFASKCDHSNEGFVSLLQEELDYEKKSNFGTRHRARDKIFCNKYTFFKNVRYCMCERLKKIVFFSGK